MSSKEIFRAVVRSILFACAIAVVDFVFFPEKNCMDYSANCDATELYNYMMSHPVDTSGASDVPTDPQELVNRYTSGRLPAGAEYINDPHQ